MYPSIINLPLNPLTLFKMTAFLFLRYRGDCCCPCNASNIVICTTLMPLTEKFDCANTFNFISPSSSISFTFMWYCMCSSFSLFWSSLITSDCVPGPVNMRAGGLAGGEAWLEAENGLLFLYL